MSHRLRCYCGQRMEQRESYHGPYWVCMDYPRCKGKVGAHPDGRPMGTPADKATSQARIRAHRVFDGWWMDVGLSKSEAYAWLEEHAPQSHIALMNEAECETLCQLVTREYQ